MVTDDELRQLRGTSGLYSLAGWQYYFGVILDRPLTRAETSDAIGRLNAQYGTPDLGPGTYGSLTRNEDR